MRQRWAALGAGSILVCLLACTGQPAVAGSANGLLLGVYPYLGLAQIGSRFRPLAGYLEQTLGMPVELRVAASYREHIEFVGRDQLDIAFIGSSAYLEVVEAYGRKPLLASLSGEQGPRFRGHIVVAQDSDINDIEALRGRSFAFGDPRSTMSFRLPLTILRGSGIGLRDLPRHRFVGSHENVALAILSGDFDAGALNAETYANYQGRGMRSIATTIAVSGQLFVVRSDLPADLIDRLRSVLLGMGARPEGRRVLGLLQQGTKATAPVVDADFDTLRSVLGDGDLVVAP